MALNNENTLKQKKFYADSNKVTVFFLFGLIIIFSFREIYSPDLGFHLRAGEWILENLKFPGKDMFTYTVGTHDYIDLHWLYQITMAIINKFSSEFGLVASNTVVIATSFVFILLRIKRKQNLNEISNWQFLFFFAVTSTAVLFETRPHAFSWLYLNLIFLILDDYLELGKNNLVFLPIIMLLWTNTHSLFILGWIVIGCYVLGLIWRDRKLWTPLSKYALLSVLICFVNPYFINGAIYPFRQYQLLQGENVFKNTIAELASPLSFESYFFNGRFILVQPLLWFHIFLILSIVVFIKRLKRIQLHELLIYLFFCYLACTAVKNIGFFIFAVLPATIKGIQPNDGVAHKPIVQWWNSEKTQTFTNLVISAASVILMIAIITDTYYINYRSNERFGFHYNNTILPFKAASFLRENKLEGKVLNHFNFGGFLIYMLPQKISIDGRNEVIGEDFYYKYSILWNQIDKKPIIDKYQPEIIIFPHQNEFLWIHYFKKDTAWRLLYFDEYAAIYIKKGYADSISAVTYNEQLSGYKKIAELQIDNILKRECPLNFPMLMLRKQYFPLYEMGLSTFAYYDDRFDEAIQIGLNGLLNSTVACPEMYYDLGHYFFENKEFERAAYCYHRYLETNSDDLALARIKLIASGKIQQSQSEP